MRHLVALNPRLVELGWPLVKQISLHRLEDLVSDDIPEPTRLLHPRDKLSPQVPCAGVLADDEGRNVIVRRGFELGIFQSVDDSPVPRDKQGQFVTIGARAVGASVHP